MKIPRISFVVESKKLLLEPALVVLSYAGDAPLKKQLSRVLPQADVDRMASHATKRKFRGALKEVLHVPLNDDTLVVVIGVGDIKNHSAENFRKAGNRACEVLRSLNIESGAVLVPESKKVSSTDLASAVAEGALLGSYQFDRYKSYEKEHEPATVSELHIAIPKITKAHEKALQRVETIAEAVFLARDLENENSHEITPHAFEQEVRRVAREYKLRVSAIVGDELTKKNLNLIMAVGRGAEIPPRLLVLEYRGRAGKEWDNALVGKGITFDTGGLNIKPAGPMTNQMHIDMAGAATVLATVVLAARLKLSCNLVGVMAMAENAVDARSTKPGTIIRSYAGKSVEIVNTDAEGRLVLADALAYTVKKYQPKEVVDLATLTGAVLVALGSEAAGIMGNNARLIEKLREAGSKVHERLWELPMFEEYNDEVKGNFSDLKNLGSKMNGGYASSIVGAKFLEPFVGETAWAHLDVAGTAILDSRRDYMPANGTGFGVRLLIEYLEK